MLRYFLDRFLCTLDGLVIRATGAPVVRGLVIVGLCPSRVAMSREHDPYRIPRAGWEIAPTAGLASVDLNGNHGALTGGEFIGESTVGGMLVFAIYQALLTGLRTEAMRKRG